MVSPLSAEKGGTHRGADRAREPQAAPHVHFCPAPGTCGPCVRDVTDGKTNWFATTPAGLRLDANCRLGKPGRYNCRYLNMMSSADDDETRRTVAQALVVAHYKCFKYLY